MFTPEQKSVLLRYFEEYGMTSTHRRNTALMQQCANEVGTTIERIKVMTLGASYLTGPSSLSPINDCLGTELDRIGGSEEEEEGWDTATSQGRNCWGKQVSRKDVSRVCVPCINHVTDHVTSHVTVLQGETSPRIIAGTPAKKFKRVNGYNLFFSDCVRTHPEISTGTSHLASLK